MSHSLFFSFLKRGVKMHSYLWRYLKGEGKRQSILACMPAMSFSCGIFPWRRRASGVRESPQQGSLTARVELGYWLEMKGTACVGCGTVYISGEIKTNLTKVKTVLNLPAQIPTCLPSAAQRVDCILLHSGCPSIGCLPWASYSSSVYSRESGECVCRTSFTY